MVESHLEENCSKLDREMLFEIEKQATMQIEDMCGLFSKSEYSFLKSNLSLRSVPVSYTHMTLPTTPYV